MQSVIVVNLSVMKIVEIVKRRKYSRIGKIMLIANLCY